MRPSGELTVLSTLILALLAGLVVPPVGCTSADRDAPAPRADAEPGPPVEVIEELWPDGQLRLRAETVLQPDGTRVNHGTYTRWHTNGNKEYEATYVHGEIDGVAFAWHKNGQLWTEEHYQRGIRHGIRRNWDENGRLRGEESYFDGKPHGTWTIWKGDGSVKWHGHFEHGRPK
jgi:hypothetical protein